MSKKAREEIKKLQSMKAGVEAEITTLQITEKNIKQEISTKKNQLNTLNQRIRNLSKNNDGLTVSEHAILRYLERVMGLNIEDVVEKILPKEEALLIESLGNGHFPINNGQFRVIIKNGVVITVYTDEEDM